MRLEPFSSEHLVTHPPLDQFANSVSRLAAETLHVNLQKQPLAKLLGELLYGEPDLLNGLHLGLVTRTEVASAVAAHMHTMLERAAAPGAGAAPAAWSAFISGFEEQLQRRLM